MWEAFGFVAVGIAVGLVGRHYRSEYWRMQADRSRAAGEPANEFAIVSMRRAAGIFLTTGAMMVIVGLWIAASEIWRVWRGT